MQIIFNLGTSQQLSFSDLYSEVNATQSCLTLCNPTDCSPPGSSVHGDSPGKSSGMGCHALLQEIFPNQGSNPGLPHCRQIFLPSEPPGKPFKNHYTVYQNESLSGPLLGSITEKFSGLMSMALMNYIFFLNNSDLFLQKTSVNKQKVLKP